MDRPEYIKCVLTGMQGGELKGKTWCGASVQGWTFFDPTHAALNGLKHGRPVACPECSGAIAKALENGRPQRGLAMSKAAAELRDIASSNEVTMILGAKDLALINAVADVMGDCISGERKSNPICTHCHGLEYDGAHTEGCLYEKAERIAEGK